MGYHGSVIEEDMQGQYALAEAIKSLREKYPRSRALLEELNGIKF